MILLIARIALAAAGTVLVETLLENFVRGFAEGVKSDPLDESVNAVERVKHLLNTIENLEKSLEKTPDVRVVDRATVAIRAYHDMLRITDHEIVGDPNDGDGAEQTALEAEYTSATRCCTAAFEAVGRMTQKLTDDQKDEVNRKLGDSFFAIKVPDVESS